MEKKRNNKLFSMNKMRKEMTMKNNSSKRKLK
jgi:hypothetical protein